MYMFWFIDIGRCGMFSYDNVGTVTTEKKYQPNQGRKKQEWNNANVK